MPTKKTVSTDMKKPNKVLLDIQYATTFSPLPTEEDLNRYVELALSAENLPSTLPCNLTIRIVAISEIHALNLEFRGKDKPTNVLSFPFEMPTEIPLPEKILGDIVICPDVLVQEAKEQQKAYQDHFAHMVIHGVLHLLGYDHENETEAEAMESLEIQLLDKLNIQNPYQSS